jgi:hypothetical protein
LKLRLDALTLTDEDHAAAEIARGGECAVDFRIGRAVAPHRIDDDLARQLPYLLHLHARESDTRTN